MDEARQFTEKAFFEYHLYTLNRPATVLNNEQKQVTLLEASDFGIKKRLIFYGAAYYFRGSYGQVESNQKVGVFLDFEPYDRPAWGMTYPLSYDAEILRMFAEAEGSALPDLPRISKLFSAGQISYSKVRAMTRWHGEQMDHQLAVLSLLQRE